MPPCLLAFIGHEGGKAKARARDTHYVYNTTTHPRRRQEKYYRCYLPLEIWLPRQITGTASAALAASQCVLGRGFSFFDILKTSALFCGSSSSSPPCFVCIAGRGGEREEKSSRQQNGTQWHAAVYILFHIPGSL